MEVVEYRGKECILVKNGGASEPLLALRVLRRVGLESIVPQTTCLIGNRLPGFGRSSELECLTEPVLMGQPNNELI